MIRVEVTNAFVVGSGTEFLVLLKSTVDNRVLPISVGQLEAQSIAIKLNSIEFPRPLTHDLFKAALEMLECKLVRVEVCDLRDDTFYAMLTLEQRGVLLDVDSRPSDAIALALRFDAPVFVAEKVMDQAGVVFTDEDKAAPDKAKPGTDDAGRAQPETLQKKLEQAVKDERYEDAARLRDELKKLNTHN
jgi:uncharacterized protein